VEKALDQLAQIQRPPATSGAELPLFLAEGSFREAYLRLLVARNATLREAAAAAGVPYRSFQRMLNTYGIRRSNPRRGDESDSPIGGSEWPSWRTSQPRNDKPTAKSLAANKESTDEYH
jgi:hypothetical protein